MATFITTTVRTSNPIYEMMYLQENFKNVNNEIELLIYISRKTMRPEIQLRMQNMLFRPAHVW
jgi:hypothetical protein